MNYSIRFTILLPLLLQNGIGWNRLMYASCYADTVKVVFSDHSKIDIIKILMENGSLKKVKSIAECSKHSAILLTCIKRA